MIKIIFILLAVIISAALMILAFPPYDIGFLAWFGFVPLLAVLLYSSGEKGFIFGFLWGLIFYLGGLPWFYKIFGTFGFVLIAILAFFPALFSMLIAGIKNKFGATAAIIMCPVIWTGAEYFRGELWNLQFSFLALGYSQHGNIRFLQAADIAGIYGISFALIFINAALAFMVTSATARIKLKERNNLTNPVALTAVAASLFLAINIYGGIRLREDFSGSDISMLGIQSESSDPDFLLKLSNEGIKGSNGVAGLVIWPEYSLPYHIEEGSDILNIVSDFAVNHRLSLLFGGEEKINEEQPGKSSDLFRNTAFLISRDGKISGKAAKLNPIQFFDDGEPGIDFSVL